MLKFLTLCISGVMLGCIYGLIYKASGLMSFVQGDMLTLGAFLGLTFYSILGLTYWLSLLLTMLCAFAFGMLLEKGVIRRLLNKKVMPIYVVLATIAISYILQNGSQLIWGTWTLNFPSVFKVSTVKLFGLLAVQPEVILCLILSMVSMVVLHLFMNKTKLGTAMRTSSMDSMAAESCSINVSLTTGITWGVSAMLAAMAVSSSGRCTVCILPSEPISATRALLARSPAATEICMAPSSAVSCWACSRSWSAAMCPRPIRT